MFAEATANRRSAGCDFRMARFAEGSSQRSLDEVVEQAITGSQSLEQLGGCLLQLLEGGFSVWEDGTLLEIRALVDQVGGLRIVIHTREHGPPHFHVIASGINASFAIDDCHLLAGDIDGRRLSLVRYWHAHARPKLVKKWNETRPSDCPVGPITA